jgi:Type IV secretion-system coupling protein DNA-binding domain
MNTQHVAATYANLTRLAWDHCLLRIDCGLLIRRAQTRTGRPRTIFSLALHFSGHDDHRRFSSEFPSVGLGLDFRDAIVRRGCRSAKHCSQLVGWILGRFVLGCTAEDETKHFKFMGTTSSGKSRDARIELNGALKRGDLAVIADPDGAYLSRGIYLRSSKTLTTSIKSRGPSFRTAATRIPRGRVTAALSSAPSSNNHGLSMSPISASCIGS